MRVQTYQSPENREVVIQFAISDLDIHRMSPNTYRPFLSALQNGREFPTDTIIAFLEQVENSSHERHWESSDMMYTVYTDPTTGKRYVRETGKPSMEVEPQAVLPEKFNLRPD